MEPDRTTNAIDETGRAGGAGATTTAPLSPAETASVIRTMNRGICAGIAIGRQEQLKDDILEALSSRFGTIPEELRWETRDDTFTSHLKYLRRLAQTCADLQTFADDFRLQLAKPDDSTD